MSCHDSDPMSTGNDDAHEEGRVPAPNSPNDASDSKPRNDEKRSSSALSATRGALAPGDAPQSHSQRNASSGHRASTIYASVPVESDNGNNRLFIGRDDPQTTGARLQYPLDMRTGAPQGAPAAAHATKRPAEEPPQPAAKRHASQIKVGPLAPPPALPSLPVPAARTPALPSNNVAATLGAANPPVRSVNYHANPLLSGNATSRIECQMCAPYILAFAHTNPSPSVSALTPRPFSRLKGSHPPYLPKWERRWRRPRLLRRRQCHSTSSRCHRGRYHQTT
jgi:hypothetical protein